MSPGIYQGTLLIKLPGHPAILNYPTINEKHSPGVESAPLLHLVLYSYHQSTLAPLRGAGDRAALITIWAECDTPRTNMEGVFIKGCQIQQPGRRLMPEYPIKEELDPRH
jgi:hypothetical protein